MYIIIYKFILRLRIQFVYTINCFLTNMYNSYQSIKVSLPKGFHLPCGFTKFKVVFTVKGVKSLY